jgi:hypothetical protein
MCGPSAEAADSDEVSDTHHSNVHIVLLWVVAWSVGNDIWEECTGPVFIIFIVTANWDLPWQWCASKITHHAQKKKHSTQSYTNNKGHAVNIMQIQLINIINTTIKYTV